MPFWHRFARSHVLYVLISREVQLGKTGYLVTENARMIGCSYYNNYTYKMDDVTVIDHRGGQLLVADCMFRKHSPNAAIYKGDRSGLVTRDNLLEGFDGESF